MKLNLKRDLTRHGKTVALWLAAATVLALVFSAYLQPGFMLDLGSRFVMCF